MGCIQRAEWGANGKFFRDQAPQGFGARPRTLDSLMGLGSHGKALSRGGTGLALGSVWGRTGAGRLRQAMRLQ